MSLPESPTRPVPPPPPKAHTKRPEDGDGVTTGFEQVIEQLLKSPKNRRTWPSHDISPKPPKLPEDPIFAHFQEKAEEDSASCVFLLWGSGNSERFTSWAVDVPITKLESEDLIFASLAKRYAKELGIWRRWLSFRKFSKLKPVNFRFICCSSEKFLAFVEPMDLNKHHKIFSEKKDKEAADAEPIMEASSYGLTEMCFPDIGGRYGHSRNCPMMENDFRECPFEQIDWYKDQMRWIETSPFLSCYFRNPAGARSQNILRGFDENCFRYLYRDVRLPTWKSEPQTRYLKLNGLYIETTWDPIKCLCIFLGLLVCVLVVGRLCWGSWEVTFGAGSFFIALPMLVLTVFSYYEV